MVDYYICSTIYIQHRLSQPCSEYFSQAINSLITGWTLYTKNVNPLVLRIDHSAVGLYVRTSGFIFFRIDNPTRTGIKELRR